MRIVLVFLFNYLFCAPAQSPNVSAFAYQLNAPSQTLVMPTELKEVSGISLSEDGKSLVAVQDEAGTIFYLNKTTGKIEQEVPFWDKGDYEDLAVVGKMIYVVKSSGTIYEVPQADKNIKKYNFGLDSNNDVEGLAYDARNNRLLLACKKQAGPEQSNGKRGIYAFDLQKKVLSEGPVYTIANKEIQSYLNTLPNTDTKAKLLEDFQSDEMTFAPSAIAVHPQNGNLYLLSAVGNMLLVLDTNGKVLHLEKLKKKVHLQPEGICFDQDGTMYISNEGKDGEMGKIYVFKAK
ncbi:MAG: SdiA-regulated domain-containing protein [Saprospiraceae bacterium]